MIMVRQTHFENIENSRNDQPLRIEEELKS